MKLFLLDPKLLSCRGHYFHADLAIYEECKTRGIPIEVLANAMIEPEVQARIPARPFFSLPADPDDAASGDFSIGNETVERDLKEGLPALGPEDVVFVVSVRDNHLGGIHRWYLTLPEPRPRVCLRLLFEPGFGVHNGGHAIAASLAEQQLRAWTSLPATKLSLIAESRDLAAFYETLCGFPVSLLPMPTRYPEMEASEALPSPHRPHLIFLGEGRPEKGFALLPAALRAVLTKYPNMRLTLQTSRRFDIDPRDLQTWRALSPNVSVVRGPLSIEQYEALLLSADVVLVPYEPQSYARRSSQIFLEAIGAGKVALTTRGTWMHQELQDLGLADLCVEEFSSAGIAAAADRLLSDWPAAAQRARQAAARVRRHHNPTHFVDELLRVVGYGGQQIGERPFA